MFSSDIEREIGYFNERFTKFLNSFRRVDSHQKLFGFTIEVSLLSEQNAKCDSSVGGDSKKLRILTGKSCILLSSVQEWLLGCFGPFSYVCTIN